MHTNQGFLNAEIDKNVYVSGGKMCIALKNIRNKLGYSIRDFAELIGCNASSYQCYEEGRRKTPETVLQAAQAAHSRDKYFFGKHLDESIKFHARGGVPNEAKKGDW